MRIGIDGNEANHVRRVGVGAYSFELLKQFKEISSAKGRIKFQIYLKEPPISDMPKERDGWQYRVVGPKWFWTQFGLPFELTKNRNIDVFFSPTHYAPRFCPVPSVISIMDLSFHHFPHLFAKKDLYQLRSWTAYSVKQASRIITISQASKNDIIKLYQLPLEKVVVTYPGIKLKTQNSKLKITMQNSKLLEDKYKIGNKYILFVGTIQPRKNIDRLVKAFAKICNDPKFKDIDLVIVGKKGWLFDPILKKPKELGIEKRVIFLDYVFDNDLKALYRNALFFILPSLYEGFGFPVLEAMQQNCPVITSNVSSLPEVGGNAALYVDPENVDDIADKMLILAKDDKLRRDLIAKGRKQVEKFKWENTAKKTLEVLEAVVKGGKHAR